MLADKILVFEKGNLVKEFLRKDILENIEKLKELGMELPEVIKIYQRLKDRKKEIRLEDLIV